MQYTSKYKQKYEENKSSGSFISYFCILWCRLGLLMAGIFITFNKILLKSRVHPYYILMLISIKAIIADKYLNKIDSSHRFLIWDIKIGALRKKEKIVWSLVKFRNSEC